MVRGQNPGKFQQGPSTTKLPLNEPKQEYSNLAFPPYQFDSSSYPPAPPPKLLLPPSSTSYNNTNPAQLPSLTPQTPPTPNASTPLLGRGIKRPNQTPSPPISHLSPPSSPPKRNSDEGWTKDDSSGNMYTAGKVGINTTNPQEALTVHGNILVTGDVLKPSDERIKMNIQPIPSSSQLETIEQLQLYDYDLKNSRNPDGSIAHERGVLAQELQRVLPSAVRVLKNVTLSDGTVMPELLVVQDRALLFENIGATQELSRSVKEQRSRLTALSETFTHSMQEMKQSTRKLVHAMGSMMQYVLSEKKVNYENSCFFLSIFGLGPAWTMYIFGFFLPFLWFFGLFYIASAVSCITRFPYGFERVYDSARYIGMILGWHPSFELKVKLLALGAVELLGILIVIIFFIYWRRKHNEHKMELKDELVQAHADLEST